MRGLVLLALGSACAVAPSTPEELLAGMDAVVLVRQSGIPDVDSWIARLARHTWIDLRRTGRTGWERLEIMNSGSGLAELRISPEHVTTPERGGVTVSTLRMLRGTVAERAIEDLDAWIAGYDDQLYVPWPGPNSNTFAERAMRAAPQLRVELDHNAIGKDFAWLRLGRSGSGSGLELETPILGLQLGWAEGIELHLLQLTFGIALFPPAIKFPFLPRLGWRR